MNRQTALVIFAALALGGAAWMFVSHRGVNLDRKADAMHRQGGSVLAELARQQAGSAGRILLIEPDPTVAGDAVKQGRLRDQVSAFEKALGPGLAIAGRESIAVLLSRQNMVSNRPAGFTTRTYRDFIGKHADATLVVSFVGAPQPLHGETLAAGGKLPPLVCLSQTGRYVPDLMAQGLVMAAIVPRSTPAPVGDFGKDWFDVMYEVVTPATIAAWSKATGIK